MIRTLARDRQLMQFDVATLLSVAYGVNFGKLRDPLKHWNVRRSLASVRRDTLSLSRLSRNKLCKIGLLKSKLIR